MRLYNELHEDPLAAVNFSILMIITDSWGALDADSVTVISDWRDGDCLAGGYEEGKRYAA
jgi:hypothetical protein